MYKKQELYFIQVVFFTVLIISYLIVLLRIKQGPKLQIYKSHNLKKYIIRYVRELTDY